MASIAVHPNHKVQRANLQLVYLGILLYIEYTVSDIPVGSYFIKRKETTETG